jgi:hypothetical protein
LAPFSGHFDPRKLRFAGLFAPEGVRSANFFLSRAVSLEFLGDSDDFRKTTRHRSPRKIAAISIGSSCSVENPLWPHMTSIAGLNDAAPFRPPSRAHGNRDGFANPLVYSSTVSDRVKVGIAAARLAADLKTRGPTGNSPG